MSSTGSTKQYKKIKIREAYMKTNKTWQIPIHWNSRYNKILQNILLLPLKLWHGKIAIVWSMQSQEEDRISSKKIT